MNGPSVTWQLYLPNRQRVARAIAELFGRESAYSATDLMPMKLLSLHCVGRGKRETNR